MQVRNMSQLHLQQQSFNQFRDFAQTLTQAPTGPSATTPGGTHIQCQAGQDLTASSDGSISCTQPKPDRFEPSLPPIGIMPAPGGPDFGGIYDFGR